MCMACEEMQLFYAYLDAVEEAKRKAQPWQCEVTVIPPEGEAAAAPVVAVGAASSASRFSCDDGTDAPPAGVNASPAKP